MRHVDDGMIHAWLDHQVTEPQQAAWITTHLRECTTCSARLAEEEATVRDAEALLASVAPYADGSREAFEALVAATQKSGGIGAPADARGPGGGLAFRRWLVPAALAATIAIAIGLGWTARYIMSPQTGVDRATAPSPDQKMARSEVPAEGRPGLAHSDGNVVPSQTASGGQQQAAAPEFTAQTAQPAVTVTSPPAPARIARGDAETSAARSEAGATVDQAGSQTAPLPLAPAVSETVVVSAPPPAVDVQNARQRQVVPTETTPPAPTFRTGADSAVAQQATAPVAPPPPPPSPAPAPPAPVNPPVAEAQVASAAAAPPATGPSPSPSAAAAAGRGGGRGGGAGGGRGGRAGGAPAGGAGGGGVAAGAGNGTGSASGTGTGVGFGAGAGVGPAPAVPPATDGVSQGRIMVDGLTIGGTAERADGIEWTVLPRELVVTRSGMALYGINGLTPARTMMNADGSKVRTVYVVNAAEVVLLQEKRPTVAPTANQGQAAAQSSETTLERLTPALGALQQGNPTSVWSSVRGELVLTLRAPADAAGLGARVRPD